MSCSKGPTVTGSCNTFPAAGDLRKNVNCNDVVYAEIAAIQAAILDASKSCKLSILIDNGTPLTSFSGIASVEIVDGGDGLSPVEATIDTSYPLNTAVLPVLRPIVTNGAITSVEVISSGSELNPIAAEAYATTAGSGDASFAVIENNGRITLVSPLVRGTGYQVGDMIEIVHPYGTGAAAAVATIGPLGEIYSTVITAAGENYQTVLPTISASHPTGTGFVGLPTLFNGQIISVTITAPGGGYASIQPKISIDTDNGTGAALQAVVDQTGSVTSFVVTNPGAGYQTGDVVTVLPPLPTISTPATGTVVATNSSSYDVVGYFNAWFGIEKNELYTMHINAISDFFKCLGYAVTVRRNTSTNTTIAWEINW